MSCEKCGHEIKNYGVFLGGVRCKNYCNMNREKKMIEGNAIVNILMRRDGLSLEEAYEHLVEARERLADGDDPEEILYEEFGLEPDYLFDLLG